MQTRRKIFSFLISVTLPSYCTCETRMLFAELSNVSKLEALSLHFTRAKQHSGKMHDPVLKIRIG
jgi:hypothetical protein